MASLNTLIDPGLSGLCGVPAFPGGLCRRSLCCAGSGGMAAGCAHRWSIHCRCRSTAPPGRSMARWGTRRDPGLEYRDHLPGSVTGDDRPGGGGCANWCAIGRSHRRDDVHRRPDFVPLWQVQPAGHRGHRAGRDWDVTPYIALQLQSITLSFSIFAEAKSEPAAYSACPVRIRQPFWVAAWGWRSFTILFGTRNLDANERHHGVVTADRCWRRWSSSLACWSVGRHLRCLGAGRGRSGRHAGPD